MRAGQHYARDESGIQSRPFFRAYKRVVARDEESDDEDVYANDDVDNFRVYRHAYTWNRDDVVSKSNIYDTYKASLIAQTGFTVAFSDANNNTIIAYGVFIFIINSIFQLLLPMKL